MLNKVSVSVIITCKDLHDYLPEAIESVRAQTRKATEIIIVHDGCEKEPMFFKDTETIIHWKSKGVSRSRNEGAMLASSDNLIFLDADDCLSENFIEAVTDKRVETQADIIYPNVLLWSRWHKDLKLDNAWYESAKEITWENMKEYNQLVVTSLIPKPLYVKVNGMDHYPMLEDYDFYLKCMKAGATFAKAPIAVLKYRQRENSRNHQAHELKNQLYWEIKEKYAEIKKP